MRWVDARNFVACLLITLSWPALARAQGSDPVELRVLDGSVNFARRQASIDLEIENHTQVTVRVVGAVIEYDTATGTTATFESQPGMDLHVAPGETVEETATFDAEVDQGEFFDWRNPYTIDLAVGADVGEITSQFEQAGDDPDRILALLDDVTRLSPVIRRARNRFTERIEALPDWTAWFDWEAIGSYQPDLESALCTNLGRRVRRARGNEARVSTYLDVTDILGRYNLYPDCIDREDRMAAARALVATDRAQDALVLTERDESGEVLDDWREIYIAGRLALAAQSTQGAVTRMFRPGLESIDEVQRLDPDNPRLPEIADRLLERTARHVDELLGEGQVMEALELVQLMRTRFADNPATERASQETMHALVGFAEQSLARDRPVLANNAYVRGLDTFSALDGWTEVAAQIQRLRSDYLLRQARAALAEGRLDDAEEALEDAEQTAEVDPAIKGELVAELVRRRWAAIDEAIDEDRYEDAMLQAQQIDATAENREILGDARPQTYLRIAEAIWDRYGLLAGIASRTRLGLAEEALELGRSADPDRASALATRFFVARWLFPSLIFLIVVVVAAVVLLRGAWRRRRKARRLWQRGNKHLDQGELAEAASLLQSAYELVALDDSAASILGEDTRGHVILHLARVHKKRGRKDRVQDLRGDWDLLDDWERPHSKDFDEALESGEE